MDDQEALAVHPAADAYRLMSDDELADLTESIVARGLHDPITIGILDGGRWLIDGRNRLAACEAAGVAPHYEEVEFPDEDALRAFVVDRNERRNISKGQKAMGYAINFPEGKRTGRGNKVPQRVGDFGAELLRQARTILRYSPGLARAVRDGTLTISEAFTKADIEKKQMQTAEARLERLREKAPDFAALVDETKMTLAEAEAAAQAREKEQREEIERMKQNHLRSASQTTSGLLWWSDSTISELKSLMESDAIFADMMRKSMVTPLEFFDKMTAGANLFLACIKEEFK